MCMTKKNPTIPKFGVCSGGGVELPRLQLDKKVAGTLSTDRGRVIRGQTWSVWGVYTHNLWNNKKIKHQTTYLKTRYGFEMTSCKKCRNF
jgi:hypothetical protein